MTPAFRTLAFLSLIVTCLSLGACSKEPADAGASAQKGSSDGPPVVYTVNYPLSYFAERIGGDRVKVVFPVMDGDPAYWAPDGEAVRAYQDADLILLNGAHYAKWVDKVTLPESKLVDTSKAFHDRYIMLEGAMTHSHGPDGAHEHKGAAFTTWLDLSLANEHAKTILQAFGILAPDQKEAFKANYDALKIDLLDLDKEIRGTVAAKADQPLIGSHPVYQYLNQQYGLNLKSLHWEPDVMPDASQWAELEKLLADHPAQWMVWEGEPMLEVVTRLETLGVKSLVFDPCGNRPDEGDFLSVMKRNVKNLEAAF